MRPRLSTLDVAHRQANTALTVHFQHLHANHIALLELVADALDALVGDLRDVHQAVPAGQDGDEGAEVHQACDLALVDAAHFDVGGNQLDAPQRLAPRLSAHRGDLHRAVALDVDGGAGLLGDLTDDRTALANDVADLLRVDLDRDDRGGPLGHLLARRADDLVHLLENVQAAGARLIQRNAHDLGRHALDLDVHLQRGNAILGAGDLEVHVAKVILIPEDVSQHLEAAALQHQTHRHTGHRRLDRNPGIHQQPRGAAPPRHRA